MWVWYIPNRFFQMETHWGGRQISPSDREWLIPGTVDPND